MRGDGAAGLKKRIPSNKQIPSSRYAAVMTDKYVSNKDGVAIGEPVELVQFRLQSPLREAVAHC